MLTTLRKNKYILKDVGRRRNIKDSLRRSDFMAKTGRW